MAVFRLYKGGANTYEGWNGTPTTPYNSQTIATIIAPTGAVSNKEITSIPSPFARIDLVKSAFAEINQACNGKIGNALLAELDKDTIYHKMVSDSLDVGEIFFNIDKYKKEIQIITWSPDDLQHQLNSPSSSFGQKCYADSLLNYWLANASTYNFNSVNNIYILNYIGAGAPRPLNVIGATSPATLFFSNANDLSYVKDIQFGQDKPFDNVFQPLYKRDEKYIEFLWWLKSSIPNFATLFPEVHAYLQYTYMAISNPILKSKLNLLQNQGNSMPEGLLPISVNFGNQTNNVEILGYQLYQKAMQPIGKSDFTIKSSIRPQCNYLVLPVEAGNKYSNWIYTTAAWGTNNSAPAFDSTPIIHRTLPLDGTPQPYLTISDFLEDNIYLSPYKLNSTSFYDGSSDEDEQAYLLPLKPLFFEFFSAEELVNNKMVSFEHIAGDNVRVTLSIPTQKGFVEYSRLYSPTDVNLVQNSGHLVETDELEDCDVMIQPAVAMPKNVSPYYTLAAVSPFTKRMGLTFYKRGKVVIPSNGEQVRNGNVRQLYKTRVYTMTSRFECIQLNFKDGNGMLIPTLPEVNAGRSVSFAVDLGTSNTHVEYVVDGNTKKCSPLEYSASDRMMAMAFLPKPNNLVLDGVELEADDLRMVKSCLERDFMPDAITSKGTFHFPTRTVLSYSKGMDWNLASNPMEMANICLPYGKQMPLGYNDYAVDIKWSSSVNAQSRVASYIKNILLVLRNKTLTLGGELDKTTLTWFYPTSMTPYRINLFQNVWNTEFHKCFGQNAVLDNMSESVAPANYHTQNNSTAKDMLTIDIGGGTTDMAFASQGKVGYVTSFRFAANALFEDSFSRVSSNNGIVDYFKPQYLELARSVKELESILASYDTTSANMANVLFTLADIPVVREEKIADDKVNFLTKLRNDSTFKLEFIIFYAAILYHAGKMIKAENLSLPRHIAFSGNGSNVLKVLVTPDTFGRKLLADFSKIVLEKASGVKYEEGCKLEILGLGDIESPKCSTCKGGLLQTAQTTSPENIVLKSADGEILTELQYSDVTDDYIKRVVDDVYVFFDMLRKVNKQFCFAENFGSSDESWNILDNILDSKEDVTTFVSNGIKYRMGNGNSPVTETFFFYPIASILQKYSLDMFNYLKEKNNG